MQQHPHFAHVMAAMGAKCDVMPVGASRIIALRRGPISYVGRGVVETAEDLKWLRRRRALIWNAEGGTSRHLRQAGFRQIMTATHVADIDLRTAFAPLPKWRQTLRQGKSHSIVLRHAPISASDRWILTADRQQQITKRFRAHPYGVVMHWPRHDTMVSTAWHHNQAIAVMVFLIHGTAATYHIGWTGDDGRRMRAHYLLLEQAQALLRQRGVERLELGAIDTVQTPGIARFKIGTGATVRQLGGTWIAAPTL